MDYMHENINVPVKIPAQVIIHSTDNYIVMQNHWHRSLEIDFTLDAQCKVMLNGRQSVIGPYELILINSGDIHSIESTDMKQVQAVSLIISYDFLKEVYDGIDGIQFVLDGNREKLAELSACFMELYKIYTNVLDEFYYVKTNQLIYQILYLLLSSFKKEKKTLATYKTQKYMERFKRILEYMTQNYEEPLTLGIVADYYGVSKEHLARIFKKYMGTTFLEYLDGIRLKKAYQQLMETDCSVLQIALDNGFSDTRSFINIFKKEYHTTPHQFRKNSKL